MGEDTRTILINIVVAVCLLGVLGFIFVGLAKQSYEKEEKCKAAGGTYLHDNGICLDVKSIPVN